MKPSKCASYKEALHKYVDELSKDGHLMVSVIVEQFMTSYPELIEEAKENLMLRQLTNEVRSILSAGAYTPTTQLFFEGMDLPAYIAVRHRDSETTYIRTNSATLADLEAGEVERRENVAHAQVALNTYRLSVDRVRPIMIGNPSMTVDEALTILSARTGEAA